jgi:hypothetical protein
MANATALSNDDAAFAYDTTWAPSAAPSSIVPYSSRAAATSTSSAVTLFFTFSISARDNQN